MRKHFNWLDRVADQFWEATSDILRLELPHLEYVLGERFEELTGGKPVPEEAAQQLSKLSLDWTGPMQFRRMKWNTDPYRYAVKELRRLAAQLNESADQIEGLERLEH